MKLGVQMNLVFCVELRGSSLRYSGWRRRPANFALSISLADLYVVYYKEELKVSVLLKLTSSVPPDWFLFASPSLPTPSRRTRKGSETQVL